MMNEPWSRSTAPQGHVQGITAQFGSQMIVHCPTDNLARGHVFEGGDIEPSFVRIDVSDVSEPNPVRGCTIEPLFQQIWRRFEAVIAVCGARLSVLAQARRDIVFPHYSGHAPLRNVLAIGFQILVDPL
ncbi:hypothetical protein RA21_08645 [Leisingera sp. ANG-DT]|nr:hypothetical protein RA21_08645 [Leisingera sp. ANG-DT]